MKNIIEKLDRNTIETGGFHGIVQKRLIVNSKYGPRSGVNDGTWEGIGNLVYFADSWFGEGVATGLHPHQYIDVLTFVVDGQLDHEGSLEHGVSLQSLDFQVQKSGKEGFMHNEVNKGEETTRMLQLWLIPERVEDKASFRVHKAEKDQVVNVYGKKDGNSTQIDVANLSRTESYTLNRESLVYVVKGTIEIVGEYVNEGVLLSVDSNTIINSVDDTLLIISYIDK
ncbi:pirin family protein [uncultured Tenacibaculum sp.]|uniref:pirin family protein n=1 Tax=uncultured Tenacibaculum sp. TaxID=174713 RepID=UPI0026349871|nr:pirin family protein [uncultured Tenacibaculum sp.]